MIFANLANSYWISYVNDWSLTKGDPVLPPAALLHPKKQYSLTVQDIIKESVQKDAVEFLAQTDFSHPKLRGLVLGHLVNNSGLCPSVGARAYNSMLQSHANPNASQSLQR